MKCPECVAAGQRSTVYQGGGFTTAMSWSPHFDEDGVRHSHNPNQTTWSYTCSNGHSWSVEGDPHCSAPGCTWPAEMKERRRLAHERAEAQRLSASASPDFGDKRS